MPTYEVIGESLQVGESLLAPGMAVELDEEQGKHLEAEGKVELMEKQPENGVAAAPVYVPDMLTGGETVRYCMPGVGYVPGVVQSVHESKVNLVVTVAGKTVPKNGVFEGSGEGQFERVK